MILTHGYQMFLALFTDRQKPVPFDVANGGVKIG